MLRDLLYQLFQNPILLLVVVFWVLSGIASAAAKAKRTQQQRQRSAPPVRREEDVDPLRQARAPAPRPAAQTAEDIARQLREMLGLETEPAPPPRPVAKPGPAWDGSDQEAGPRHREPQRGDDELVPGNAGPVGELHQQMVSKRDEQAAVAASVAQHLGHSPTRAARAAHLQRKRAPRAFDARHAEAAIVALEVLGPPRALRPYDGPSC